MNIKKIKITKDTDLFTFYTVTFIRYNFWLSNRIKSKRKCFYDKTNNVNRFMDNGEKIESDFNHSINAVLKSRGNEF